MNGFLLLLTIYGIGVAISLTCIAIINARAKKEIFNITFSALSWLAIVVFVGGLFWLLAEAYYNLIHRRFKRE
jgi:hypothetical protein